MQGFNFEYVWLSTLFMHLQNVADLIAKLSQKENGHHELVPCHSYNSLCYCNDTRRDQFPVIYNAIHYEVIKVS